MSTPFVAVLMGSESDLSYLELTFNVLDVLKVPYETRITSAHRTPEQTREYVRDADQRGCAVFIAAAGLAAHLAGAVAAQTIKPVIGIPIQGGPLNGLDALYSTVQMPGGIPVASVAIGKAGARNAGFLAAQILALSNDDIANNIKTHREENAKGVMIANQHLQDRING